MNLGGHIHNLARSNRPYLMKIAKYIGELIYDYECVVIPGLGGFISTEKSAEINPNTNMFTPPSKEIHFNIHLKANDGLLINYVARNEDISFKNAKQRVDKFVFLCHNALNSGKRISFSRIGFIFQDEEKNIVFHQEKSVNYNADSFGLSSFVSPAIRRPSAEEKIKEVFTNKTPESQKSTSDKNRPLAKKDRKPSTVRTKKIGMIARKKPSRVKQQLLFISVILIAMASYYVVNNYHSMYYYWDRYQVRMPFLYNGPNDYLAANAGVLYLDKINVNQAGWLSDLIEFNNKEENLEQIAVLNNAKVDMELVSNEIINTPLSDPIEDEVVYPEEDINSDDLNDAKEELEYSTLDISEPEIKYETSYEKPAVNAVSSSFKYYIIAGSFKSEQNALKFVSTLKGQGYEALLADTNSYGMFRVAFMGFRSMIEAENKLVAIRRESNPQAWILTK